jgi:hypothetical protein
MADAPDSKSGPRKWVWVQVPPSAVTIANSLIYRKANGSLTLSLAFQFPPQIVDLAL